MSANSGPFRERIEEIRRRRRARSASIVSTSELLRSDGCEGDEEDDSVKKAVEEIATVVIEKRTKQMKEETVEGEERGEFPGSPSFRVYCTEVAVTREHDSDPINMIEQKEKLAQKKEPAHGRENSSDSLISKEDSVGKPQRKEKGRRFFALTRASSRLYSFLSVKNCYSPCSATGTAPDDCPRPHHHSVKSA